jgi:hypothetical protein
MMIYSAVYIYQSDYQLFEVIIPFVHRDKALGRLIRTNLYNDNDEFHKFLNNSRLGITSTWQFLSNTDIQAKIEYIGGFAPTISLIIHDSLKCKTTINKADNVTMRVVWNALIRNGFMPRSRR